MKKLFISLLFVLPMCAQTIDVTTYGAKPDGVTDNSAAIQKALSAAASKPGSEIFFPCGTKGSQYVVLSPLNFPGSAKIRGTQEHSCQLVYKGGSTPAAFSLVGIGSTKIENIALRSGSTSNAPSAIVMLGAVHGQVGKNAFVNVTIGGYATKALVYSIASNRNEFRNVHFELDGGGAQIGFYTSAADDLGICSGCGPSSNVSLLIEGSDFDFTSSTLSGPMTAIEDKTESGTGDHFYMNGRTKLGNNVQATAFTFVSADQTHGGLNWKVSVHNWRVDNGGSAFTFVKDYATKVYSYDIEDVTWNSTVQGATNFMIGQAGLSLYNMRFVKNIVNTVSASQSTVDSLMNSVVMEDYGQFKINTQSLGNNFVMNGLGTVALPAGTPAGNNVVTRPGAPASS
jgi:hypothetical protein